ncbi:molybdenum cofactor guanylyltransferase [Thalassotalea sp. 1_MG-2023]|uniref:molybdenum cofactor guanylyltransferase n=1 Tax=Thalassotalea sp. 1_MG-2023 TaxID=3062680 RepID=UPI0026E1E279|nr:molybdenum cofactor guanylyltransferase [Thalassotalea sp. 1_MG-2023]MDO6426412.1 molybdenum cofactor guanylyltransferase [Thalassotalea sp. 1_MG-2023]
MRKPIHCLGVVLAGGKSSRMGKDKALLSLNGERLLDRAVSLLNKAGVDQTIISGDIHGEQDKLERIGPLGGIYTALVKYQPYALLVMPVDLPFIDLTTLLQLKNAGQLSNKACFYQQHYLPMYLPNNHFCQSFFTKNIAFQSSFTAKSKTKTYSVRSLLSHIPHRELPIKNPHALFNANTPQDWQQVEEKLAKNRNYNVKF